MKKLICFTSVLAFLCAALSGCVSIEFNGLYAQTPEGTDSSRTPQLETPGTCCRLKRLRQFLFPLISIRWIWMETQ